MDCKVKAFCSFVTVLAFSIMAAVPPASAQNVDNCGNAGRWRSPPSNQAVTVRFHNVSGGTANLFWINFQGQRQLYATIPDNGWRNQPTFRSHAWIATDASNVCLVAVVTDASSIIDINQPSDYSFGAMTLASEVWIGNKRLFRSARSVDVEFVEAGEFDWIIADASGKVVKSVRHRNEHGGWTSIDLPSLGLSNGIFSIGFRNASPGSKQIKHGDVLFK